MLNQIVRALPILMLSAIFALPLAAQTEGILLLAHGGDKSWNKKVGTLAAGLNEIVPVEVAFGMARKQNIEDAIDRLSERNVAEIVAVPLFISPHSSIIRVTEYLLGVREEAPPELERYARMSHGAARGGYRGRYARMDHGDATHCAGTQRELRSDYAGGCHPQRNLRSDAADRDLHSHTDDAGARPPSARRRYPHFPGQSYQSEYEGGSRCHRRSRTRI